MRGLDIRMSFANSKAWHPALYQQFNFSASSQSQPAVTGQRIGLYLCPSEINDRSAGPGKYPSSYATGTGDWLTADHTAHVGGNGAYPVLSPGSVGLRSADITDGFSTTVGFTEVKTFGDCLIKSGALPTTPPVTPADVLAFGGTFTLGINHTRWAEGAIAYSCMTFVFPPNTAVNYASAGRTYDVDFACIYPVEYGAITARSFHPGGVNALFMDGSVHFVTNSIPQMTWRALGTRNGGESVSADEY